MRLRASDFLRQLPLAATAKWPDGVFDIEAFARGGLTLELFAPHRFVRIGDDFAA